MIYLLFAVIFAAYNSVLFYFAAHIFDKKERLWRTIIVTTLINGLVYFTYIFFVDTMHFDFLAVPVYILIYTIEFRYLYKDSFITVVFGVAAFTINFISRRLLTLTIASLVMGVSMGEFYSDINNRMLMNLLPLMISAPYILGTKKFLPKKYFDMIFSSKSNVKFSTSLMITVCIFLALIIAVINPNNTSENYIWAYVVSGSVCAVSYHIALAYAFYFARLQLKAIEVGHIRKNIQSETKSIDLLENEYTTDHFTGFKTREFITKTIDSYVASSESFFLVFIDIDGLKIVNDKHGHTEGDFYIKKVSQIIDEVFKDSTVSRYGGDEFVIVKKDSDRFSATQKSLICANAVNNISNEFDKDYSCSISYAITMVLPSNKKTTEELIQETDEKMYQYKKTRKKARV